MPSDKGAITYHKSPQFGSILRQVKGSRDVFMSFMQCNHGRFIRQGVHKRQMIGLKNRALVTWILEFWQCKEPPKERKTRRATQGYRCNRCKTVNIMSTTGSIIDSVRLLTRNRIFTHLLYQQVLPRTRFIVQLSLGELHIHVLIWSMGHRPSTLLR